MVEILEHGQLPEKMTYTTQCRYCNTKFRFKKDEAKLVRDQRDGDFLQIACPLCKRDCNIDPSLGVPHE